MNLPTESKNTSSIAKDSIIVTFSKISDKLGTPCSVAQLYIINKDLEFSHQTVCNNLQPVDIEKLTIILVNEDYEEPKTNDVNHRGFFYNMPRTLTISIISL